MNSLYKDEVRECYFCKSGDFIPHSKARFWSVADLNFVECKNCGLIFCNPMPTLDVIIRANDALNIVHVSRGTISQYRGGKQFVYKLKKIKDNGILLDVGCAEGFFLKGIEDNSNWKAEGLDIIKSAVDFANNELGVKVYFGVLEDLKECENRYNYIRMNNIIEHVQNPVNFLRKTNQILKTGGLVWCSTPNGVQDGAVFKTANKQGTVLNLLENHFFYYKPKTLKKIFESCGFEILKSYCEGIKHSLTDFGLLPGAKIQGIFEEYNLNDYKDKKNVEFKFSREEIKNMHKDKSLKDYKLKIDLFINRISKMRLPSGIPIGHQQNILAKKINH
ncbi:MAG: class I SAM-dependent methyltransferase [Ignavibacteriae bacterium]|nr:class I SAM-dependent methyltransferase [Ignavibacteriota bacterium]